MTSGAARRQNPMDTPTVWGRLLLVRPDGTPAGAPVTLAGSTAPDLRTVDALLRLKLVARRRGADVRLVEIGADLEVLLEVCGLLGKMSGQPEGGEEVLDVEEGMEAGDPVP